MNYFKLQANTLKYVQAEKTHLYDRCAWLQSILAIYEDFLPQPPQPYIDTFWISVSQHQNSREERANQLIYIASAYYRIHNVGDYITQEFHKILKRNRIIPKIIKFNQLFISLQKSLAEQNNLPNFYQECLDVSLKIEDNKKQQFYLLYKWKISTCLIVCTELLQKQARNKKEFLNYLRDGRSLLKSNQLPDLFLLSIYEQIMALTSNIKQKQLNNKYLSLEYQALCKKAQKEGKQINPQQKSRRHYLTLSNRKEKGDFNDYFQEDEKKKKEEILKTTSRNNFRKKTFLEGLAYMIQKSQPSPSKSLIKKKRSFRKLSMNNLSSGQMNSNNGIFKKKNRTLHEAPRLGFVVNRSNFDKQFWKSINSWKDNGTNQDIKMTNFYKTLYEKKEVFLTDAKIQKQILNIPTVSQEKPTPTFSQIFCLMEKNSNQNQSCLSFKGISSEILTLGGNYDLTIVQNFGKDLGFTNISLCKSGNEQKVSFSYYPWNFTNQPICVGEQPSFTFDDLRKQASNSQFYFQLMQEYIESDVETQDLLHVENMIEEDTNHQLSFIFICITRLTRGLIYWYYSKVSKVNGSLFIRRPLSRASDPLKFAIALDFMKKYNHYECLEKLCYTRNKTSIYQCFTYLFFGRKIITKSIVYHRKRYVFFTLTLEKLSTKNIVININGSYFQNLDFNLTVFDLSNWDTLENKVVRLEKYISKRQITLMLLQNIIENKISQKTINQVNGILNSKYFPQNIYHTEDSHINIKTQLFFQPKLTVEGNQDKKLILNQFCSISFFRASNQFHPLLKSFIPMIMWHIEINLADVSLKVINIQEQITRINGKFIKVTTLQMQCGVEVKIFYLPNCICQILITFSKTLKIIPKYQYAKNVSAFYNRSSLYVTDMKRYIVNKIKCNRFVQIFQENYLQVIVKKIIKTQFSSNPFVYCALSWHSKLECWRIDAYSQSNCLHFFAYFEMDQCNYEQIRTNFYENVVILTEQMDEMWIFGKTIKLMRVFKKLNTMEVVSKGNQSSLELVQKNKKLLLLILPVHQSNLYMHEVDENMGNDTWNIFMEVKKTLNSTNLYTDLFRLLYIRFCTSTFKMQKLQHPSQLSYIES